MQTRQATLKKRETHLIRQAMRKFGKHLFHQESYTPNPITRTLTSIVSKPAFSNSSISLACVKKNARCVVMHRKVLTELFDMARCGLTAKRFGSAVVLEPTPLLS